MCDLPIVFEGYKSQYCCVRDFSPLSPRTTVWFASEDAEFSYNLNKIDRIYRVTDEDLTARIRIRESGRFSILVAACGEIRW